MMIISDVDPMTSAPGASTLGYRSSRRMALQCVTLSLHVSGILRILSRMVMLGSISAGFSVVTMGGSVGTVGTGGQMASSRGSVILASNVKSTGRPAREKIRE